MREDMVGRSPAGKYMTGSVSRFSHCYLLPGLDACGRAGQEECCKLNRILSAVAALRPEATTITIWTYPGNFERLRELKHAVRQMGFPIAVRPLPQGMPIGALAARQRFASE